jgi:hypothetical protein
MTYHVLLPAALYTVVCEQSVHTLHPFVGSNEVLVVPSVSKTVDLEHCW